MVIDRKHVGKIKRIELNNRQPTTAERSRMSNHNSAASFIYAIFTTNKASANASARHKMSNQGQR